MQPKKRPSPRRGAVGLTSMAKSHGPRRPVGMQTMGPAVYAQLRRALHQLGGTGR